MENGERMPVSYTVKIVIDGQTSSILTTPEEQKANLLAKSLAGNEFIQEVRTEKYESLTTSSVEPKPKV